MNTTESTSRENDDVSVEESLTDHERTNTNDHICNEAAGHKSFKQIVVLIFYYVFRGIGVGVASAVPVVLMSRRISLTSLGILQLTGWPLLIVKPVLAVLIDSLYIRRLGRRKSWILPSFSLLGVLNLAFSSYNQSLFNNMDKYSSKNSISLCAFERYARNCSMRCSIYSQALSSLPVFNVYLVSWISLQTSRLMLGIFQCSNSELFGFYTFNLLILSYECY